MFCQYDIDGRDIFARPDSTVGFCSDLYFNPGVTSLNPSPSTFLVEIAHEIISTDILSLPLIQVGQLTVTGRSMCT